MILKLKLINLDFSVVTYYVEWSHQELMGRVLIPAVIMLYFFCLHDTVSTVIIIHLYSIYIALIMMLLMGSCDPTSMHLKAIYPNRNRLCWPGVNPTNLTTLRCWFVGRRCPVWTLHVDGCRLARDDSHSLLLASRLFSVCVAGILDDGPKWVILATNGTNLGLFQNVLKSDLKKSPICPICCQYDPLWTII